MPDKTSLLLFLLFFMHIHDDAQTQETPPQFNLSQLEVFLPGGPLAQVKAKFGEGQVVRSSPLIQTLKFKVQDGNYLYVVYAQFFEDKVIDSYASFPSHFGHDLIHKALLAKLGNQKSYEQKNGTAQYEWEKDGIRHIYQGSCSITCFGVFYSMQLWPLPKGAEMATPLLAELNRASP